MGDLRVDTMIAQGAKPVGGVYRVVAAGKSTPGMSEREDEASRSTIGAIVLDEAATVEARYRWTPKWEFEARQTLSFRDDSELGHEVIVRRVGHDLLVELGVSKTTGEGGSTFTLRLRPELLFRPSKIGYIEPR